MYMVSFGNLGRVKPRHDSTDCDADAYKPVANIHATASLRPTSMSFVNGYKPPPPPELPSEEFGPDPYDLNFCFPIDVSHLESERVKLVPFIPRLHAKIYFDQIRQHPELETWLPSTHNCLADTLLLCERVRQDSATVAFAVIDKRTPDPNHPEWDGSMAGTLLLLKTVPMNLTTEIGWVVTFPAFQRTYVTSNATGILLRYCLATPEDKPPGLGLRRVQWFANAKNLPSIKTALRLGFKLEGKLRWERIVPADWKSSGNGKAIRVGDPMPDAMSRDSTLLSFCADDWESGGRELVQELMDRTVR
jgi:RimJ/RimL family protein N-acetyltransferase